MAFHIRILPLIVLLFPLLTGCAVMKTEKINRQISKKYTGDGFSIGYLLYLPSGYYEDNKEYPLVLFLHGSGERGKRLDKVRRHGPPRLVHEGKNFPFILVSPQCPEDERWNVEKLAALLNDMEGNFRVDEKRVYVTGLSMGGYGTWKLAQTYPDRFAAIVPVCGGGDFLNACVLKDVPVWVFHGAKDRVVSVEESERMVKALERCKGNVRFTVYPDAGHDSWTETYDNPEVYSWLLMHSLDRRGNYSDR